MTAGDLKGVMEIGASLKEAPRWTRDAYETALDPTAPVRRLALVAESTLDGEIVGFAVVSVSPPEAELETIAVAPAFQRRGVARQLFDEMIILLKCLDVVDVRLEVRASNGSAITLYRAAKFVEVGRRSRYYVDPIEDAVVMRLELR
jgi:[ribosomal protein S18]-alanine N-acetyltransferase